ncbi:histidine phosphatase family protein [Listeria ivanovii]|uniref:histidine phosphatase family protein n=1 Tax=Listeria ivanovii TaxID=1638 RepID=UPI000DA8A444|nr:histidine phosphatase family protein [Listeria ivanovii]PZG33246.1 histidine phosphatase family protein [Listeria ivanovii]PZG47247.1 histidine phosphatase family protein [Listeria ivanovii]PZH10897.1 histidine phosphatase family protein [Listeria ivanovii]
MESSGKVVIYLTRHGKTILNTLDRVQGWADSPLTEEGALVAHDLGRGLKGTNFVAAYASDRGRAIETARIVMKESDNHHLNLAKLPEMREFGFGKFEGEYNQTVLQMVANEHGFDSIESYYDKTSENNSNIVIDTVHQLDETGMTENSTIFEARLTAGLEKILVDATKLGSGDVLVVAHGMVIHRIIEMIDPSQNIRIIENASVTKVIFENGAYSIEEPGNMFYVEAGKQAQGGSLSDR